jgi:4-amino-4-deoxy-L-arabinose transferase-like glycosyltransferase
MKEGLALRAFPVPSVRARGQCIAWTALALVWLGSLGWRALLSPDEGRYASIALEMLRSGDWLTPRLNGLLYFEKPPLQYWLSAGFFQLFGVNEFAARLWPGLAGLFTIVTTSIGARLLWGEPAGHAAAIVTAGMAWVVANSHFLSLDMGLTFFLTLALCGFLVSRKNPASPSVRRNGMWLCWAAMAGATLSKGLVGLLIPGATLALYSLVTRRFGFWRDMHWVSGAAIFLALAAPWFIAMSLAHPGFFDFFFIGEHFRRFLTDEAHRTGPVHYFVPFLIAGSLPWTTLVLAKVDGREPDSGVESFQYRRLLWIWIAFVFVFFSVSRSKLPSYILPVFPAMALLIANGLTHASAHRLKRHLILPALAWIAFGLAASLARGRAARPPTP